MCVSHSFQTISCVTAGLVHFFFIVPATTEIYTLSLHDALPISSLPRPAGRSRRVGTRRRRWSVPVQTTVAGARSEEHTSELQSPVHLVCRLLLEKKKKKTQ